MIAEPIPSPVDEIPQTIGLPDAMSTVPSALQSTPSRGAMAPVRRAIFSRAAMPPPPDVIPMTFALGPLSSFSTVVVFVRAWKELSARLLDEQGAGLQIVTPAPEIADATCASLGPG